MPKRSLAGAFVNEHRLETLGYERARGAGAWDSLPSNYYRVLPTRSSR